MIFMKIFMITNQIRKLKLLIIFEDLIGDMFSNKKTFCTKNVKLCFNQNFIMKIAHKRDFQQIAINDSLLIDFKEFMNL